MQHPVFQNLKTILLYTGCWILLAGIQFSVLFVQYRLPAWIAVTDSLVCNLGFGCLGLSLWFVIRYNTPGQKSRFNFIFNHLTSFTLFIVIWLAVSVSLLSLLFQEQPGYSGFMTASIPVRLISGVLLYVLLGLTYYLLIYYTNLQEKLKKEAALNTLLKESELNMLRSQINPHFLFNSLNSISALTLTDPERSREMLIKLSDFLRYSVSVSAGTVTSLSEELDNMRRYLEIEKIRFGEKLSYTLHCHGECLNRAIPVMLLQPVYENAIKHGVYESTEVVNVETRCFLQDDHTEITIVNDFDPEAIPRKGAGLGLKNIRERLRLTYHRDDLVRFWTEGSQFFVQLRVPF
jgi:sensor histidine kinase YesM